MFVPIGGILIHPDIESKYGMLGTTFGGNHLACAAGLAVLNTIDSEHLMDNVNAQVYNKTASFGTVLIIYESRPDVTVEAAGIAFKSGNKILLKGGKESLRSNLKIVELWHQALKEDGASTNWVEYLQFNRTETQAFLEKPTQSVDLIVPRGGERLIAFVKQHATCPVIISGRGNNFVYVHKDADFDIAIDLIMNGKSKISACNAVDKVLVDENLPNKDVFIERLISKLKASKIDILGDENTCKFDDVEAFESDAIWYEEFFYWFTAFSDE